MGLFKKKKVLDKIKTSNTLGEIAKTLAENNLISVPKDNNHNTFGERLDVLDKDGELPFGWYSHNKNYFEDFDKLMPKYASDHHPENKQIRIEILQEMIQQYYDFKNKCYKEGECHKKYFQNMWEHCHNSRNDDFEYITLYEKELEELKSNL